MCIMPSFDNVALIDFCNVALFCEDHGTDGTHAIKFGDFVGYTSIP